MVAEPQTAELCLVLSLLVRAMVDKPEAVAIEPRMNDDGSVTLELRVDRVDIGKVIGLQGRTSRSLRVILATISKAQRIQYSLNIEGDTLFSKPIAE